MNQKMKSLEVDNLKNLAERQYEHIEPLVENLLPGKGVYLFAVLPRSESHTWHLISDCTFALERSFGTTM